MIAAKTAAVTAAVTVAVTAAVTAAARKVMADDFHHTNVLPIDAARLVTCSKERVFVKSIPTY